MKKQQNNSKHQECPDEILINRYIFHECSPEECQDFENHLIKCFFCRRKVAFLRLSSPEIEDEKAWEQFPERLHKKGLKIIKNRKESILKYNFQFAHGTWKVLKYAGAPIPQTVAASRKDTAILKRSYNLKEYRIDIEGKKNIDNTFKIHLKIKKTAQEEILPSINLILQDLKSQKILKQFTSKGMASFEKIAPGEYSINFIDPKGQLYEITLNIKGD